ncbi:sugar transferase [Candidatus Gracilibacteria bacterium]|nr:sugar transferase [Candidatus Gracilibacteria bacterium]
MKKSELFFTLSRIFSDMVFVFLALIFTYYLRMVWFEFSIAGIWDFSLFPAPEFLFPFDKFINFSLKLTGIILLILAFHGRYKFNADEKIFDEFVHIFWGISAGMTLLLVYFFFSQFPFFSRLIFGLSWIFTIIFVLGGRLFIRFIRKKFHLHGLGREKIIVLGTGDLAIQAIKALKKIPHLEIIGVLSEKINTQKKFEDVKILGTFSSLGRILKSRKPNEILLASKKSTEKINTKIIKTAQMHHTYFRFIPDELGLDLASVQVSTLETLPLLTLLNTKIDGWGLLVKQLLDFFCAVFSLLLLSPIFLFITFRIWISNTTAPIFYRSKRIGKNGKEFICYKFRTMIPEAEKQKTKLLKKNERKGGILFKMKNDPRITTFGKTLRKYSLDELPQLWNILKGDMSFIGPRPHLQEEVKKYPKEDLQILSIKPGLSGFSQINGRSNLSFEEEMNFETFYMKKWNLGLDAIILFKSIYIAIKGENAS